MTAASAAEKFNLQAHKSPEVELQRIFTLFINSLGKDSKEYRILIKDSEELNASAGLNKTVVVNTKLIETLKSEVALAFVVAHELGHIEEKHVVKGMSRQALGLGLNVAVALVTKSTIAYEATKGAEHLQRKAYSRSKEKSADVFAIGLVNKFYCDVPGKLEFFEEISKQKKSFLKISYFSTHPMTEKRIAYLKDLILKAGCVV